MRGRAHLVDRQARFWQDHIVSRPSNSGWLQGFSTFCCRSLTATSLLRTGRRKSFEICQPAWDATIVLEPLWHRLHALAFQYSKKSRMLAASFFSPSRHHWPDPTDQKGLTHDVTAVADSLSVNCPFKEIMQDEMPRRDDCNELPSLGSKLVHFLIRQSSFNRTIFPSHGRASRLSVAVNELVRFGFASTQDGRSV